MSVIMIRTMMHNIPKCCKDCSFYTNASATLVTGKRCRAMGGHPIGKEMKNISIYKEKPNWCPLKVLEKEVVQNVKPKEIPEPSKKEYKNPSDSPRTRTRPSTICWECVHAIPNPEKKHGCAWSILKKPVPGWIAEETKLCGITSFNVKHCPKFKRG